MNLYKRKKCLKSSFFIISLLFVACTPKNKTQNHTPTGVIRAYIEASQNVKKPEEKERLAEFLTGESKTRLLSWSDEQFLKVFMERKREDLKISFRNEQKINEQQVNVTYELSYVELAESTQVRTTVRKMAEVLKVNDQWLISKVFQVKELLEYQNELSLPQ